MIYILKYIELKYIWELVKITKEGRSSRCTAIVFAGWWVLEDTSVFLFFCNELSFLWWFDKWHLSITVKPHSQHSKIIPPSLFPSLSASVLLSVPYLPHALSICFPTAYNLSLFFTQEIYLASEFSSFPHSHYWGTNTEYQEGTISGRDPLGTIMHEKRRKVEKILRKRWERGRCCSSFVCSYHLS